MIDDTDKIDKKLASEKDVVDFWFDDAVSKLWFNSTPDFDQDIQLRFEATYQAAVNGELDSWADTAEGALALVLLFDQFPLNMYRGDKKSFETESLSQSIARTAIQKGFDKEMPMEKRSFFYMPFMHSENSEDQQIGVNLFESAGLENNLRFAKHHQGIIRRFGRFPHRNVILGRESTAEEELYLNSDEAFSG
ncbi:MAG: DUF924 domain-containing protein [Gammaproteobacteria bacterium]|nr:DUF924 domain-containing protein [Gammaproteobacteria bacterium]